MKKNSKTGLVRGLSVLLVLILALSLVMTSCADKNAQQTADEAKTAADEAQKSADKANTAAADAKDKADKAEADAKNNAEAIAKLPDEKAVAEAIKNILTEYVKGTTLDKDSIVTSEELSKFLTADQTAQAIAAALTDYAKTAEVLETLKGYVTEEKLNELKTEMNNATTAKLNDYITAAAADSKYLTEAKATTVISNALADMAKKSDLDAAKTELQEALASKTELDTKLSDAKTELKNMLSTGLGDQKKLIDDANKKIEALETELEAANKKISAAEEKIKAVEAFETRIKALENVVTGASGGLDTMIKDLAQNLIDENNKAYNDATPVVIKKLNELQALFSSYDANHYSNDGYNKLLAIYTEAEVKLLRSLNSGDAEKAFEEATTAASKVPNLADEAYAKYLEIGEPIIIAALTECENKEADSKAAITAARTALNAAKTALGDEAMEKYATENGNVNLEDLVNKAEMTYATLEDAKATAAALQDEIDARIPAKDIYEAYTENDDILALKDALAEAKTMFDTWVGVNFGTDTDNVNIARLVDMNGYSAAYAFLSQAINGTLLNNLRAQIRTALFTAKYIDAATTPYNVNGNCLHSTLAALEAVKTAVDADAASADITEVGTAIGAEYTDLTKAIAYATAMTAKKAAAEAADGVIAKIVALGEADLLGYSNISNVTAANDAFTAWAEGMDDANIADILGTNKTSLEALVARAETLTKAKTAADTLNEKIAACGSKITDMAAIKALKAELAEWLTTYAIVSDSANAKFVAENYELVKHADLDALYDASKAKADAAAADSTVLAKINAVDTTGKVLHQKGNIEAAEAALAAWLKANELTSIDDIDATVLDTANAENLAAIKAGKTKLDNARTLFDDTLAAAKAAFEADKAKYDAFDALTAYVLKNGETVKAAYNAAKAWFDTYVDETLGMADLEAQSVVTGFTAAEYDKIVNAHTAYVTTVNNATAALNDVKGLYDAIGTVNVYSYAKVVAAKNAYAAWCTTYGVTEADYDSETFESALAAPAKTLSANITAAEKAYNDVVAAAKEEAEVVKGKINSWTTANVTIYSYNEMKELRSLYDAWSNKYLIGNSFDDINDADLAAMETVYNKLVSLENEFKSLSDAKKAETDALKALLNALNRTVVLADKSEIEAARAAYTAWLNGKNDKTKIDASKSFTDADGYKCYEITDEQLGYLTTAEGSFGNLSVAREAAINAITSLDKLATPGAGMSADVITAYKNALKEAKEKAEAFNNMGEDKLSDDLMKTITKAEFYYGRYETAQLVQVAYEKACIDNKLKTNYESVLKPEFDKVLDKYLGQIYNDKLLGNYYTDNTVLDTSYKDMLDELKAVVANNPEA